MLYRDREIDAIIARGERRALLRYFLSSQINVPVLMVLSALALLAAAFSQSLVAGLVALTLMVIASSSALIRLQRYRRNRKIMFWKEIRKRGLSGTPPMGNTQLLIDKIVKIEASAPGDELLPTRQAIKLVAAYERQSQHLQGVYGRMDKLDSTRRALREKTAQLQALGEAHPAGLRSLEEARANHQALQKVADEIRNSCDRLEAILGGVQKTARARQLHRELDQISATDPGASQAVEFEAESAEAIERQIGREIETYLQLERETEQQLR